jgi:hypothetical protein
MKVDKYVFIIIVIYCFESKYLWGDNNLNTTLYNNLLAL